MPSLIELVKERDKKDKFNIPDFQKYIQGYFRELNLNLNAGALFGITPIKDIFNKHPEIKRSNNEDISKYYSKILERKLYQGIYYLINDSIKKIYTAFCENKPNELNKFYTKNIVKEVLALLNSSFVKQEVTELLQEHRITNLETNEEIRKHLSYRILCEIIPSYLKNEVKKCILDEEDENHHTLLHWACNIGSPGFVQNLIEHGWDMRHRISPKGIVLARLKEIQEESNSKDESTLSMLEQKRKEYLEVLNILEKLSINSIVKNRGGSMGMIALLGASTSPSKKAAVYEDSESKINPEFSKKVVIRPVANVSEEGTIFTPQGTELFPVLEVILDKDISKSEKENKIAIYLDKKNQSTRLKIQKKTKNKSFLTYFCLRIKKAQNLKLLDQLQKIYYSIWDAKKKTEGRYVSQIHMMKHLASEIAGIAGFEVGKSRSWQWCHIIAFSMGGLDNIYPTSTLEYDIKGPQQPDNLVIGTAEANAQMLVVEDIIKRLIYKATISLYIQFKVEFDEKLKKYHIPTILEYTIQDQKDNPEKQITFSFNTLSRRKITPQEPEILGSILEKLFLKKEVLKEEFPELSTDWMSMPSPGYLGKHESTSSPFQPTIGQLTPISGYDQEKSLQKISPVHFGSSDEEGEQKNETPNSGDHPKP